MSSNAFTSLPPALAAAINLRCLRLAGNYDLVLTSAELDSMPHLRKLDLSGCKLTDLPAGRYLAGAL